MVSSDAIKLWEHMTPGAVFEAIATAVKNNNRNVLDWLARNSVPHKEHIDDQAFKALHWNRDGINLTWVLCRIFEEILSKSKIKEIPYNLEHHGITGKEFKIHCHVPPDTEFAKIAGNILQKQREAFGHLQDEQINNSLDIMAICLAAAFHDASYLDLLSIPLVKQPERIQDDAMDLFKTFGVPQWMDYLAPGSQVITMASLLQCEKTPALITPENFWPAVKAVFPTELVNVDGPLYKDSDEPSITKFKNFHADLTRISPSHYALDLITAYPRLMALHPQSLHNDQIDGMLQDWCSTGFIYLCEPATIQFIADQIDPSENLKLQPYINCTLSNASIYPELTGRCILSIINNHQSPELFTHSKYEITSGEFTTLACISSKNNWVNVLEKLSELGLSASDFRKEAEAMSLPDEKIESHEALIRAIQAKQEASNAICDILKSINPR